MAKVSNKAVEKFIKRLNEITHRVGSGKVAIDSAALRKIVRKDRKTAAMVVEIYCGMAQSNPAYFQGALLIATAYQIEFKDHSFVKMVQDQVEAAGGEESLKEIDVSKEMPAPEQETPERIAAKKWWESTDRKVGRCDNCYKPMKRGDGYLVRGPILVLEGGLRIDTGQEIICEYCFRKTKGGTVWE